MKREFIIERQGKTFVLYAGLLEEAHAQGLREIATELLQIPSPENGHLAVCRAVVTTEKGCFSGIGDASPENVGRMIAPHILRMAETRAKARALRDAINVGMTALEELGGDEDASDAFPPAHRGRVDVSRANVEPQRTAPGVGTPMDALRAGESNVTHLSPEGEPRGAAGRSSPLTEKQLKAIYAIGQGNLHLSKTELDAKCRDIYGNAPGELSRWEASQLIDLLKQDKVA